MRPGQFLGTGIGSSPAGRSLVLLCLTLALCPGCKKGAKKDDLPDPGVKFELTSPAFKEGETIPTKYTGDGENKSPPLQWAKPPSGTQSLALLCEDPDAPGGIFTHWVLFDLPPDRRKLEEGIAPADMEMANGARQGKNSFGNFGYGGPKPPSGQSHRYIFKLYALDRKLNDLATGAIREQLLAAMEGHILGTGRLTGKYSR
jgi:Raf kinase inhibitor-like YbhB/YbcL family protein